ncbi:MAG: prepilin peptidase [Gammaproteobacteria bacterium]|nr:prepilin peptidase [Gammaproteobacteria bacterium]
MSSIMNGGRPGLTWGRYPERPATRDSPFDKWVQTRIDAHKARRRVCPDVLRNIAARIEEVGCSLEKMPDEVFAASLLGMRTRLALQPMDEALLVQAFAAIREAAGRTLGMRHFPSQLMGGWVLYHAMLAQMQTGEGKTLTATLPAGAAALTGVPVHVVTANDYLARRDAEAMRPVYEALGVSVGIVTEGLETQARVAAYACDVTYCTNKSVAFDYLRDRVARGSMSGPTHSKLQRLYAGSESTPNPPSLLLRGLCFAIVDEADSVLIDEARTPLILSRSVEGNMDEQMYRQALEIAAQLVADVDFAISARERKVTLTQSGHVRLATIAQPFDSRWSATRRREELVCQALCAQHLYIRDVQYVVSDNRVQIIDASTGRLMPDRSWERGLHQLIEAKEGCDVTGDKETLARISYQRFFSRYLKLSGMTGTTTKIERELEYTYGLPVVPIPTHRPIRRATYRPRTFTTTSAKYHAILQSVRNLHAQGRPILIGTRSVEDSEKLGSYLSDNGLEAHILNARHAETEAQMVADAGLSGRITVATNIAGRGTDVQLRDAVAQLGGLHVLVTERNEAARIDRQLIGRCSRQGDPGSYQIFGSLDDELPALFYSPWLRALLQFLNLGRAEFPSNLGRWMMALPQRATERRHRRARRSLQRQDERLGDLLSFSGEAE